MAGVAHGYDKLIEFEGCLIEALGRTVVVDGHDIGSDEMNIFILTDDPLAAFKLVQQTDEATRPEGKMRAAYRSVDEEDFVCLWPPDLRDFSIA